MVLNFSPKARLSVQLKLHGFSGVFEVQHGSAAKGVGVGVYLFSIVDLKLEA